MRTLLLLLLASAAAFGQNATLAEYVEIGLAGNRQLIREKLATDQQAARQQEARGKYLPDLTFDASYIRAQGGRLIEVPAGDLVNPAYRGLNALLGEDRYPTDIANTSEQFLPDDFHETKLRLVQPLVNSRIFHNVRTQGALLQSQQAKTTAFENELRRQIRVGYYQYLSAREQQRILSDTRVVLEEVLRLNERLVANGKATREVVYAAQFELSKLDRQRAAAERQAVTARLAFNFLLARDLEAPVAVDTTGLTLPLPGQPTASLRTTALQQRPELDQLRYGIEASEHAVRLSRGYLVPEVNLVADAGFQGFGYTFDSDQDFWLVRLGLTWPIFQGNQNRLRVQQAVLAEEQRQTELADLQNQISLEVSNAYYALREAQQQLLASRAGLTSARENFRLVAKKYAQQQVLPVAYNEARTNYTTAQIGEVIARYQLHGRVAELRAALHAN